MKNKISLFDIIMIIITGGLWLIVIFFRKNFLSEDAEYEDTDFDDNDDDDDDDDDDDNAYWRSNAIKWFMIGLLSKDKANKDNHEQQRIPCDGDDYDECEYEEDDDNEYS